MIQPSTQTNPLPEQNKAKPEEATAGAKHAPAADEKIGPNAAPVSGSNANVKS